ncbi:hypothetical protein PRN20_21965 [Devosia sp. ZB163]|uniref:hypothetical protein n=1 Tax=Devosia sp. ZB163 TaxID=3025938 RepID=UPI00235F8267|nr:hypothetical protein [Devosia sp. ZB163]MDC9826411.1 hypothetical protein [Devosia sp. ZB163]
MVQPRRAVAILAALAALLCVTSGLGDEAGATVRKSGGNAAGDWICTVGDKAIGTLSLRENSYVLNRFGQSMAGEYHQDAGRVTVTNGPLLGWGADDGLVMAASEPRKLEFQTANGDVLSCHEVL